MLQNLMAAVQAFRSPHKTAVGHENHQLLDDSCDQAESEGDAGVLSQEMDSTDESEPDDHVRGTLDDNQREMLGTGSELSRRRLFEVPSDKRGKSHTEFWKTGSAIIFLRVT